MGCFHLTGFVKESPWAQGGAGELEAAVSVLEVQVRVVAVWVGGRRGRRGGPWGAGPDKESKRGPSVPIPVVCSSSGTCGPALVSVSPPPTGSLQSMLPFDD